MEQKVLNYISDQSPDRLGLLSGIHEIICENDLSVVAVVEPMMGKEMIIYKSNHMMKYALASMKNYMSLHVLPIYGSASLFMKYQTLLPKAKFQKGCINFNHENELPLEIVKKLIVDCSTIDLKKIREDYLKSRKT
jgi:hypothetical protein